jgi:hypothetical protein
MTLKYVWLPRSAISAAVSVATPGQLMNVMVVLWWPNDHEGDDWRDCDD